MLICISYSHCAIEEACGLWFGHNSAPPVKDTALCFCHLSLSRHTINNRNDGFYGKHCPISLARKGLNSTMGKAVLPNQATVLKIKRAREGAAGRPDVKPVSLIHKGLCQHRRVALSVQLEPSGRDLLSAVSCLF